MSSSYERPGGPPYCFRRVSRRILIVRVDASRLTPLGDLIRVRGEGKEVARRTGGHNIGHVAGSQRNRTAGTDEVLDLALVRDLGSKASKESVRLALQAAQMATKAATPTTAVAAGAVAGPTPRAQAAVAEPAEQSATAAGTASLPSAPAANAGATESAAVAVAK